MSDTAKRRRSDDLLDLPPAIEFPTFASEAEEADFWSTHSSHLLWGQMEDVTHNPPPGLRQRPAGAPSTARKRPPDGRMDLVSIRLPAEMIDGVKAIAARRHLPYQTLMRSWIAERLRSEQESDAETGTPDAIASRP